MRNRITWIFDLDDTLHEATPHIMPHINRSMTVYVQSQLGLDESAAAALRVDYWRRYGATLLGLMRHHDVDPSHFLWHTHQFPALERMVVPDRGALHALRKLPGRKLVFSNAPAHYARAVIDILGMAHLFDDIYTIERVRFRPKPALEGFRRLIRAERIVPARSVMIDDTLANLRAARRLGLTTVWVSRAQGLPSYVDAKIASVRKLGRIAGRFAGSLERTGARRR
jgi:putative hydrolase of the HAD superfamily